MASVVCGHPSLEAFRYRTFMVGQLLQRPLVKPFGPIDLLRPQLPPQKIQPQHQPRAAAPACHQTPHQHSPLQRRAAMGLLLPPQLPPLRTAQRTRRLRTAVQRANRGRTVQQPRQRAAQGEPQRTARQVPVRVPIRQGVAQGWRQAMGLAMAGQWGMGRQQRKPTGPRWW